MSTVLGFFMPKSTSHFAKQLNQCPNTQMYRATCCVMQMTGVMTTL